MKYLDLLTHIGTWGVLTTKECALLGWSQHSAKTALKAAQTAVTWLRDEGYVLTKRLPFHGRQHAYVLTRKGAAALNLHFIGDWVERSAVDASEWFAHGYALSLQSVVSRHPAVVLCSQLMAAKGFTVVGKRGLQRDFKCLGKYADDFDAVLLNERGQVEFGIFVSDSYGAGERKKVRELGNGKRAVLIASVLPEAVEALIRVRNNARAGNEAYVSERLPPGVVA